MSTVQVTPEDYKFFDFLAPHRWPDIEEPTLKAYRDLVTTGEIQIETLLENALVAASQGLYQRVATNYQDFTDGSDAKKSISQFRNNDHVRDCWMNAAPVRNISTKTGLLRVLVYSKVPDKFYFFAIPPVAYKNISIIEIIMDTSVGYKDPVGIPRGKWTKCMVEDFTELATISEADATSRWLAR